MIVEMNEGARRANDKIHQRSVKDKLDAIYEELRLLRKAIDSLVEDKAKQLVGRSLCPDCGKDYCICTLSTDYYGKGMA